MWIFILMCQVPSKAISNDLETLKLFGEFENNDFAAEEFVL